MTQIKLYLFGPPRLERNGVPLEVNLRKALALLIYLAVTRQPYSRDALATLFWPDKDQQAARANLRRTLYDLSQLLGEQLLDVMPETIGISAHAALWVDIDNFQQLSKSLPPHSSPTVEVASLQPLVAAAELYTGDFLAGFTLPDCAEFDDWQFFQREELRRALTNLLQQLVSAYQALSKVEEALHSARRWLQLDPLDEAVQRRLMQLYAQAGQMTAALRQYEECVRILDVELGVTPEAETTALYEAIRTRRFPLPDQQLVPALAQPAGPKRHETPAAELAQDGSATMPDAPTHNLPAQPTAFVGREQELADILSRLQDPACHLLTLVGPGGIGKTRLALEAACRLVEEPSAQESFSDGIFFVTLQEVSALQGVVTAIVQAASLRLYGEGPARQQVLNVLRNKQMLLILDNFEHLMAATELVAELLAVAPKLKLLVTSREALDLQEAWFYPIAGMRFPKVESKQDAVIAEYDAVRFFVQCVRPVQGDFSLAAEQEHVIRICRLVGGTPLALELAAAWLKVLPCKQIADEIERSLDILTTRHQNVPARHRSMRVVLEQTWERLTEAERGILRKLAVFRGGCARPAAEQVTGATLTQLTSLVEKALLHLTRDGRYEIHELVRQFAEGQMQAIPGEEAQARARHCAYYATLLQQLTPQLKVKGQKESFLEIVADLTNVRIAWQYAVDHRDIQALECATEGLWIFSDYRGTFREGEVAFQQAAAALTVEQSEEALPEGQRTLLGFLLAGQGYLCFRRGDWKSARPLMERGDALLRQAKQPAVPKQALVSLYLGWLLASRMEHAQATQLGEESMALFIAANDPWGRVAALELLSRIAMLTRPLGEARQLLQEGVTLSTAIEARRLRGGFLHKLGEIELWLGEYEHARQCFEESLIFAQTIGMRPGIVYALRDLARLALYQGEHDRAIQSVEESIAIAEELGPLWTNRTVFAVLADAYRLQGKYAEAERHYQTCLQASRSSEVPLLIANCLTGLGVLAFNQGDLHRAEQLQLEALTLFRQNRQEPESAFALCHLGHVYVATGENRAREARRCYGEALQLAIKHTLAPLVLNICSGVAQLYARVDKRQRAFELLNLAAYHTASSHETQANAHRQLAELTGNSYTVPGASAQSQPLDWQSTAQSLVEDLSDPAWEPQVAIPHNLLPQPTPFVGRLHELSEILRSLHTPDCRLLTVVGPGGIGKTRLALQAAQMVVDGVFATADNPTAALEPEASTATPVAFGDGVYFVPLQAVDAAGSLISAIAEATGFHFYSDIPPRQQLVNFLREKQMLLVLDSMEHLPEGAEIVSELLAKTPSIKLLVTSQRSLNLHEEWFHPLAGMTLPRLKDRAYSSAPARTSSSSETQADAVQFFVLCARRSRADFALEAEHAEVVRICRLVDGMPLALELAAAWLKVLSCKQIADEIERSLDILIARHHNVPANHRSMYTVLEQSWRQLLGETEQAILRRLSVIRGSFTQEAALNIAGASVMTLATFIEKALVLVTPSGRYQMHELLRQFAHKQLLADPDEEQTAKRRHSAFYLHFLSARERLLTSKTRRIVLDEMGQEIENVRIGWDWAVQQGDLDLLSQAVEPLYHFYQSQSRYHEGKELFSQAWSTLQEAAATVDDPRLPIVLLRVLARSAAFCHFLCEYEAAGHYLQESLAHAQKLDQRAEVAFVLNFLGQVAVWQGEQEVAKQYLLESLSISRQLGDKSGMASAMDKLANLTHATFGEYAESKELATQSLALSRQVGRPDWVAYALDTLGFITFCLGEYDEAAAYYRESLALFESIDDQYGIAMALGGLGLVFWAIGGEKNVEALDYLQKSLLICRTIGHQGQVVGRLAGLARILNDMGDYAQAQQLASEGLVIARELGSPVYLSHLLYCLGESAYGMGDLPAARAYLMDALHVTSETGLLAYLTIALFHYATLLVKESEAAAADAAPKQAKALELLALVHRHPTTWHVYRSRAKQRYVELEAHLPQETVVDAQARAEHHTLAEAVEMLSKAEVKSSIGRNAR